MSEFKRKKQTEINKQNILEAETDSKIYILGDTHLPFGVYKPMDIFGKAWEGYTEKIEKNWKAKIREKDFVIIAGDFSWAMKLEDSKKDFEFIDKLPGTKIFLRGNHDYWWESITKMEEFLINNGFKNIYFLYNNSFHINGINIYGTKGWGLNESDDFKNIRREALRLKFSSETIEKEGVNIAVLHYPPFMKKETKNLFKEKGYTDQEIEETDYLKIIDETKAKICYYGHLHAESQKGAVQGDINGVMYKLIAGDYIDFDPVCINDDIELLKK